MNALSLAGYAFVMGAITIIILTLRDFHRPFRVEEIRYAVLRERYWVGLIAYASMGLFFYVLVLYAVWVALVIMLIDFEKIKEFDVVLTAAMTLSLSVIASILVLLAVANTPFVRIAIDWIRRVVAQRLLARYPTSTDIVSALIARSKFSFVERGEEELRRDLANYGVAEELIVAALNVDRRVLLPPTVSLLREVCSLYAGVTALRHETRFRRFIAARGEVIERLEREYRHLMRQAAQAIVLVDDLGASKDSSSELVDGMSEFIADEAQPVRAGYQRLVAQAVVSRISGSARKEFLGGFGYDVDFPRTLPVMPLVIVFLLDWMIAVIPALMGQERYIHVELDSLSALIVGFFTALALTAAIGLGIYPKVITSFARPSLFSLPWKSYVVFGVLAYLVGVAVLALALKIGHVVPPGVLPNEVSASHVAANGNSQTLLAGHPTLVSMLFGVAFPVTTIVLSVLLDWRLQAHSINFRRRRVHDGIFLAGAFVAIMVVTSVGWKLLEQLPGVKSVKTEWWAHAEFIGLAMAFGFVVGFIVPSTVEAYIKANEILFAPVKPSPPASPRVLARPEPAK